MMEEYTLIRELAEQAMRNFSITDNRSKENRYKIREKVLEMLDDPAYSEKVEKVYEEEKQNKIRPGTEISAEMEAYLREETRRVILLALKQSYPPPPPPPSTPVSDVPQGIKSLFAFPETHAQSEADEEATANAQSWLKNLTESEIRERYRDSFDALEITRGHWRQETRDGSPVMTISTPRKSDGISHLIRRHDLLIALHQRHIPFNLSITRLGLRREDPAEITIPLKDYNRLYPPPLSREERLREKQEAQARITARALEKYKNMTKEESVRVLQAVCKEWKDAQNSDGSAQKIISWERQHTPPAAKGEQVLAALAMNNIAGDYSINYADLRPPPYEYIRISPEDFSAHYPPPLSHEEHLRTMNELRTSFERSGEKQTPWESLKNFIKSKFSLFAGAATAASLTLTELPPVEAADFKAQKPKLEKTSPERVNTLDIF